MPRLIYKRFKIDYLVQVKVRLIQNIQHHLELVYPIHILGSSDFPIPSHQAHKFVMLRQKIIKDYCQIVIERTFEEIVLVFHTVNHLRRDISHTALKKFLECRKIFIETQITSQKPRGHL